MVNIFIVNWLRVINILIYIYIYILYINIQTLLYINDLYELYGGFLSQGGIPKSSKSWMTMISY